MQSSEIRKRFLAFFEKRGHAIVPSASLVPENDSSVLFTTAGMQQFKPYYIGKADAMKDFGSLNTASIQKCVRTSDIEEVGDASHLTFFEMLGNFSFGGYFKEKAIQDAHDFITKDMGLKISYVSVFSGEEDVPADTESEEIWKKVAPHLEIKKAGKADNFWGPTGTEGPCGPTSEIYVDGIEIWNLVFNEYYQHPNKHLEPLKTPGVDTGMGLERLAMVSQNVPTVFNTDLFKPIVDLLPSDLSQTDKRIYADHARTVVFMISDGVRPSSKGEAGSVLRRLMRVLMQKKYEMVDYKKVFAGIIKIYE
jgi:alanyl-tRNA synthetase